jgi:hypothetical protein
MPIEVRQLLIKSTVDASEAPPPIQGEDAATSSLDQLREEVLAECKAWMEEKLQQLRER